MSEAVTVLTLNLRNILDRYEERKPLLTAGFAELAPDFAALQEVAFIGEEAQDAMLAGAGESGRYQLFDARSARYPDYGNSLLVGTGNPRGAEELRLSNGRCAIRTHVVLPGGAAIWFVTTHLHHRPDEPEERLRQVREIIAWMDGAAGATATVLTGDFNALPDEPAVAEMAGSGYRSAFAAAHGAEPARTRPSGIQAEGMDSEGEPGCVDYIWVNGRCAVADCTVVFDRPSPDDATLFASDHFGLLATLRL